jgi:hypothetical protein
MVKLLTLTEIVKSPMPNLLFPSGDVISIVGAAVGVIDGDEEGDGEELTVGVGVLAGVEVKVGGGVLAVVVEGVVETVVAQAESKTKVHTAMRTNHHFPKTRLFFILCS